MSIFSYFVFGYILLNELPFPELKCLSAEFYSEQRDYLKHPPGTTGSTRKL